MPELRVVASELILGGRDSGKTSRAEALAHAWLGRAESHRAVYIATAQAWDGEMRERIERQRAARAQRVPRISTVEDPLELAHAIGAHSRADTLIVVDCLTLWLTAQMLPAVDAAVGLPRPSTQALAQAVATCAGPLVLISNETAALPPGPDGRRFTESLGSLTQAAAAACERVTLMSGGLPMLLKGQP